MILLDAVIAYLCSVGIIATVYIILIPFCKKDLAVALFLKKKESVWVVPIRALFGNVLVFDGEENDRKSYKN